MVVLSAMRLNLRRELADEIGMRARVDLTLEELAGRLHRDLRHFAPQCLARMRRLEVDLRLRGREQSLAFLRGGALGLLDQLVGTMLRLIDDLRGSLARLTNDH